MAKLVSDVGSRNLTPSEAVAKAVGIYLRRQQHLYGDKAIEFAVNEVVAFLSETGSIEAIVNTYNNQDKNVSNNLLEDPKTILSTYQDIGVYGLIQLIEDRARNNSRLYKANKLLEFGATLQSALNQTGIRTQLARIALSLDKSESTYRRVCWAFLHDKNSEEALWPFAYLHYLHKHSPDKDVLDISSLYKILVDNYGEAFIQDYLTKNKDKCRAQITQDELSSYRFRLVLSNKQQQEAVFAELLEKHDAKAAIQLIDNDERFNNKAKASLSLRAIQAAKTKLDSDTKYAHYIEDLTDYAFSKDTSEGTLRNVYFSYKAINKFDKSENILRILKVHAGDSPTQRQRNLLWSSPKHLIKIEELVPELRHTPAYEPIAGKVCYVVHNSLPYSSGGYATRGHGLLTGLNAKGVAISAITRPGFPHDISKISVNDIKLVDKVDSVIYERILEPSRRDYSNYEYMLESVHSFEKMFKKRRPELVIAASNHLNALPVMFASRKLGIPFIYEIRGFWEITRLSKYPEFQDNPMFDVEKRLEALVAEHAEHIFTLTQGMIDELNSRGVDTTDRITLLPNSCNVERFNPIPKNQSLALELGIPLDIPVIGYVGTLVSYEGLDDLAIACSNLKQQGYKFRLLIVGNENATGLGKGSIVEQITTIAKDSGFEDWLIMPGRVPFEEVESYYSLIDIAPFPRKAWPVCEIVPPMKTLEALSMKKAVLVSNNTALTEMITHDVNGRIFERGNISDLTTQMKYLFDHPEKWASYGNAGRIFVEQERTWNRTADKAKKIIDNFITT